MSLLIYKKNLNIETQKTKQQMSQLKEIAENISLDDKIQIEKFLQKISKDARGRFNYNRGDATNLLPFFQKYVDPNVKGNIFGCGGCVVKMLNTMFELKKEWQSQTT
tara:strand:+ start:322 stop:642 length:321 start_codon:yes stop_codon:yes gene_type:complete